MLYNLDGRSIRIPDAEIEQNMKILEISKDEAIQMWLEDNEYLENAEQVALDTKAKSVKINHEARAVKPKTQRERVQKEDPDKQGLIQNLFNFLQDLDGIDNISITNKTKMIAFTLNGSSYELNLIRKRPPKQK